MTAPRDHGGGIDAAIARFGGNRADWLDLSTGINPIPYPVPDLNQNDWTALPDHAAQSGLLKTARRFWHVPDTADILAAPGASALIARLPGLLPRGQVQITAPTYNEHAAAFAQSGWQVSEKPGQVRAVVHPNNPDGRLWSREDLLSHPPQLLIIDESFCDVTQAESHIELAADPGVIILKSFGKFWGLAGLRLGFAIGHPDSISALGNSLGPWAVSGPALKTGREALENRDWAKETRQRLATDAARLDTLLARVQIPTIGGTDLFRLYDLPDAKDLHLGLARHHILSRIFPYSSRWLRLGLPGTAADWQRLEAALTDLT